jgi:hypothetical protein
VHHVNNDAIVVRFWNHEKTLLAPALTLMYVSREIEAVAATA